MTHSIGTPRRTHRRAAQKNRISSATVSAGRTGAAILTASGLAISLGAASHATEQDRGRDSDTLEIDTTDLTIERASTTDPTPIASPANITFTNNITSDRPAMTSETAAVAPEPEPKPQPEPEPQPEPAPEPVSAPAPEPAPEPQPESEPQAEQPVPQPASNAPQDPEAPQQDPQPVTSDQQAQQAPEEHQPQQAPQESESDQQEPSQEASTSQQSPQGASTHQSPSAPGTASGTQREAPSSGTNSSVVSAAYAGVGSPYLWGGTTTSGFDCSGFINWAYDQAGQGGLPRTTYGMESSLPHVSSPQPGDIVLANNTTHGAIYVGNGQVISATPSGGVRLHGIDEGWHQVNAILRPN